MKDNRKLRYGNIAVMSIFHILALVAIFMFADLFWLVIALLAWPVSHGVGLALGYHRLLTHRGFKTPKWLEYLITVCGTLCLQGGHIKWVANHRQHHKFTDVEGDPHSPRKGFFHSHIGWMIYNDKSLNDPALLHYYAPDLYKDPVHVFLDKFWWLPTVILAIPLFYFGGFTALLWVIFVRVTFGLHFTWLVNSACHLWGKRPNATGDDSTNNWWVAILTWGEGWHNNHHMMPTRARHGLTWKQFDASWIFLRTLMFLRLAKDVKL